MEAGRRTAEKGTGSGVHRDRDGGGCRNAEVGRRQGPKEEPGAELCPELSVGGTGGEDSGEDAPNERVRWRSAGDSRGAGLGILEGSEGENAVRTSYAPLWG